MRTLLFRSPKPFLIGYFLTNKDFAFLFIHQFGCISTSFWRCPLKSVRRKALGWISLLHFKLRCWFHTSCCYVTAQCLFLMHKLVIEMTTIPIPDQLVANALLARQIVLRYTLDSKTPFTVYCHQSLQNVLAKSDYIFCRIFHALLTAEVCVDTDVTRKSKLFKVEHPKQRNITYSNDSFLFNFLD